jgi:hypothetical protein
MNFKYHFFKIRMSFVIDLHVCSSCYWSELGWKKCLKKLSPFNLEPFKINIFQKWWKMLIVKRRGITSRTMMPLSWKKINFNNISFFIQNHLNKNNKDIWFILCAQNGKFFSTCSFWIICYQNIKIPRFCVLYVYMAYS